MQPEMWKPPVELSQQEEQIVKKIRKAKLFVFLREHRHELLDEALQQELANLYRPAERGQPPIAPAMLALALILQAYMGISDDEVIEATLMDRRWQLVLDCLDTEQAPFSKGTLVAFRQRLIEAQMDRRLIERTIEIASHSQGFGPRALRAALDSSPVWGAGRVEDTYQLVGHALSKVMRVVADQQGRELVEVAKEAGAEVVCATSLKAALDRDWDQVGQREEALGLVLDVLQVVERWVQTLQQEEAQLAQPALAIAKQVQAQDVEIKAVEEFRPRPTGRTRSRPPVWRSYRAGARVRSMDVRVRVNEGQQQRLVEKLNAMQEQQQYLFPGTMQRYVFEDDADPSNVTISLIWKDTEMPDESVIQQELSDFKQELADVLDWNTAQYRTKRAIIHT